MAVQLECEFCKDSFPEDHIIYVERLNKGHLSCHHCVNDIINKLCDAVNKNDRAINVLVEARKAKRSRCMTQKDHSFVDGYEQCINDLKMIKSK